MLYIHPQEHTFRQMHSLYSSFLEIFLYFNILELDTESVEEKPIFIHLNNKHLLLLVVI